MNRIIGFIILMVGLVLIYVISITEESYGFFGGMLVGLTISYGAKVMITSSFSFKKR
jgi:hypothetical protein